MQKLVDALESKIAEYQAVMDSGPEGYDKWYEGVITGLEFGRDMALELQTPEPDLTSDLSVGDEVVSLIDYMELQRGAKGKVVSLGGSWQYPIEVEFDKKVNLYNTAPNDNKLGFNRNELGKL